MEPSAHAPPDRAAGGAPVSIRVLLFASVREKVGEAMIKLSLERGSTTAELVEALTQQHPVLADILPSCALSVNRKYLSSRQVELADGDEVAIIPPVSGG